MTDTATDAARSIGEVLPDFVERWAAVKPYSTAIIFGDRQFTWAQWSERIRQLASGLTAAGIGCGDRIAFLDKNHPACLEATFAAASIGASIAVINWRLAGGELRYVLTDCDARLLFVGAEFAPAIASLAGSLPALERVIVVGGDCDDYEEFLASNPPAEHTVAVDGGDDALVIYSSGTTGNPKGVVLSQKALVAHTVNVGTAFPFAGDDMNLVAMPLFHVGGICYAFLGIRSGVPSIMIREPDAASVTGAITRGGTHTFLVPPVISGLLAAGEPAITAISRLHYLGYGAAPTPLPLLQRALMACPDVNFVQVFGQTELSGVATILAPADHRDRGRDELLLSVGRPVLGCEVRIVDLETKSEVPTGSQGEIWVRSDQRMTRYLNKPDATAETIMPGGWVRTGDVGRMDENRHLYVEDRIKDMIISGGENVYGPEVERVLMQHPAICDAAVIGVPDDHWGESVKAIVVASGDDAKPDAIIAFCREQLAGYKCPRTVDFVPSLPRNPSGKILKRELREPFWTTRDRRI